MNKEDCELYQRGDISNCEECENLPECSTDFRLMGDQFADGTTPKERKKKIPFKACDFCGFMLENQRKSWDEFVKLYQKKYPDMLPTDENYDWLYNLYKWWSPPPSKGCPFNYKPNLENLERREYKLKCFRCGTKFNCSAEKIRIGNNYPYCGECVAGIDPYM